MLHQNKISGIKSGQVEVKAIDLKKTRKHMESTDLRQVSSFPQISFMI